MNNYDLGRKLLAEAEEVMKDMSRAYGSKTWNLTVRRAQEVVELTLKGLLKILGVEIPRVHDVGVVFAKVCEEKDIKIEKDDVSRIARISANLAEERAPSFYMERDYEAKEAREAKENAEWIQSMAKDLIKRLS